jgi:two-component system phosphate regulon response regulator PhoB
LTPILVVDDEEDIRELVAMQLRKEGFAARTAADGPEALSLAARLRPSLILLDLMLPGMSGTEVCRRLRAEPATAGIPVIMLTARTEELDRVVGFEVGADDYVVKPFSTRELVLRIRAVLRRGAAPATEGEVMAGPLRIDPAQHRVWIDATEIPLTATEFKLVSAFVRRPGRVQTRGALLQEVWGAPPDLDTRTVDTHVKRLREKLGSVGNSIETVRGVGYRFGR